MGFADRTAFVLNQNAKSVTDQVVRELLATVPAGDVFVTRSLDEARIFAHTIMRRGYGQVFTGGGDGTLVSTLTFLRQAQTTLGGDFPAVGVLKLGTGNAMANTLGAKRPGRDAYHIVHHGPAAHEDVYFVQSDDGRLAPFAGMGYDAEVLGDYNALKEAAQTPLKKALAQNVWGYLGAMLTRTVPRRLTTPDPIVRVTSSHDATLMVHTSAGDVPEHIPAGRVLYEGPAPALSVGTIPYFGMGFTMFPFAGQVPGTMQLRVVHCGIPTILKNLYPGVWKGTYRHPQILDFLLKDVTVEVDRPVDTHVGGDADGRSQRLHWTVSDEPVKMVRLGQRLTPTRPDVPGRLLPAFARR